MYNKITSNKQNKQNKQIHTHNTFCTTCFALECICYNDTPYSTPYKTHYCGDITCDWDCGVLDCGCIDQCRGRCGLSPW